MGDERHDRIDLIRDRVMFMMFGDVAKEDIMETVQAGRGADGRFLPGMSGNPNGRPKGSLNRRTLLLRGMQEGEDLAAVRVVWDAATGGRDTVTARWVVGA